MRAIVFLQYLYLDGTETRKRRKKSPDLYEVGPKAGNIEQFFDLGLAATVKTFRFLWPLYSSLVSECKARNGQGTPIWEPCDYFIEASPRVPDQSNETKVR